MAVVFAGLLAVTEAALTERIEKNEAKALQDGILEVVPGTVRTEMIPLDVGAERIEVYKCFDEGDKMVGWGIPAVDFGFQDKIKLVFGLTPDRASITGMKVLDQKETPGLGSIIMDETWRSQFTGLDATATIDDVQVVKRERKEDNKHREIQAITGATISSVAVKKIVYDALAKVRPELEGK